MLLNLASSLVCLGYTWVSSVDIGSDDYGAGLFHAARVANVIEGRLEGKHLRW